MSFNTYSNYIRTLESMADQCRGMLSEHTPSYNDIKILKKVHEQLENLRYDAVAKAVGNGDE